jgi:hypothetical protein
MTEKNLLFGSTSLTAEEEALRAELMAWCQAKFDRGARAIPMQAALILVADAVFDPWGQGGFRRPDPK